MNFLLVERILVRSMNKSNDNLDKALRSFPCVDYIYEPFVDVNMEKIDIIINKGIRKV